MSNSFQFRDRSLSLNHAHVMGILNVTPDSFSDGGLYHRKSNALKQAQRMITEGAAIIDIGGESTRPGAKPVSTSEEMNRVLPVVEALSQELDVIISVDTSSPELMIAAAGSGAHLINDVRALQRPGAIAAAVQTGLPVCLMHSQGEPETMQNRPQYQNIQDEVVSFLRERVAACIACGVPKDKIVLDPGFGFGKTLNHNLALMNQLSDLNVESLPLLVGVSRKSMIGGVLKNEVHQRLAGSLALAAASVLKGAWILRVHDVAETYDVVRMMNAVRAEQPVEY